VRGPDFFVVKGVDKAQIRRSWIVWEEDGQHPHVIVELVSPSTQAEDEGRKKKLYEQTFRTPEYFLYYPDEQRLVGWRLVGGVYEPMKADERGWLWSDQLGLWLGGWIGYSNDGEYNTWVRFYEAGGQLIPTHKETAIETKAQVETEATARLEAEARIAALEAEIARLKGQAEQ
jgi:hypothetical protein